MFEEACMKISGLILSPVPAQQRLVEEDLWKKIQSGCHQCALDLWQPDRIFVSHELKRIAIADLCRPSDVCPPLPAAIRKQEEYQPLL